jgi:hypothetical protein
MCGKLFAAKENEEKKTQERKKALLVLICRHLCDYGYIETAERLQTEGGMQAISKLSSDGNQKTPI